jgi:hypothetical protein
MLLGSTEEQSARKHLLQTLIHVELVIILIQSKASSVIACLDFILLI